MQRYDTPVDMVADLQPDRPVACIRPQRLRRAARWFTDAFPGEVLYAVKANPADWALSALRTGGVRAFDVASEFEITETLRHSPAADLAFMNPVKARRTIERVYHQHDVRIFSLDCVAELQKILDVTGGGDGLTLVVRMAVENTDSALPLAGKFGARGEEAQVLFRAIADAGARLGASFHVGSQCMEPRAYETAMHLVADTVRPTGLTLSVLNVGGGFPAIYPGMNPPPLQSYIDAIARTRSAMPLSDEGVLWCEPGRALVAEAVSVVARVELRKGNTLFLNDGAFGNLFDAAHMKWLFPVRRVSADDQSALPLQDFRFYGPTCDSMDYMPGPFQLPADMDEGDYIEIGMLGAYGLTLATGFNGFGATELVTVRDAPWPSLFPTDDVEEALTADDAPRYQRRRRGRGVGEAAAR